MLVHHGNFSQGTFGASVTDPSQDSFVVLACNDSSIKVVAESGMLYKTILDAAPTCFTPLPKDEAAA